MRNAIYPDKLVERTGLDALRTTQLRAIPFGNDGIFTPVHFIARIN